MKKFFIFFAVLALIGGGILVWWRLTGVGDTWVQDKATGAWVRHGNPTGPAPMAAAADCFSRAGRVYAQAVSQCVPQLCAADEICINDLLDTFESLRGTAANVPAAPPAVVSPMPQEESSPAPASSPAAGGGVTEEASPSPAAEEEALPSPPASPVATANESLRLLAPVPHAALTSPFEVRGDVQEGAVSVVVRVKGESGATLIEETLTPRAEAAGGWRPFKITLAYDFDTTKSGFVEVMSQGGAAVSIPVEFR